MSSGLPSVEGKTANTNMTDEELLHSLEAERALMIDVATGGSRIQQVNDEFVDRRYRIAAELRLRRLPDPNPFSDLWGWYERWSAGDLPTWQSRREFVADLYDSLLECLHDVPPAVEVFEQPTGWTRVDRGVYDVRRRLEQAANEEQYQGVGHLCREVLISLAQVVYEPQRHPLLTLTEN